MPSKKRTLASQAAARGPLPEVPAELLDQLVKGPMTPSEVQNLFLSFQKAVSEAAALSALQAFAAGPWGAKYPSIAQSWQRAWEHVTPFFAFPPEIQRVIYTTNAIESLNKQMRKLIKTRGHFPTDEAAIKLLWLALRNVLTKSVRSAFDWKRAMNQFAILFGERFMLARG